MNWSVVVDENTWWTTIILIIVGYFVGTILMSRIYISLFRKGNCTFYDREQKKNIQMHKFGTANVAFYIGIKYAVLQFFIDFSKPLIYWYGFVIPLVLNVDAFKNALLPLGLFFVLVGNNYPIFWKFKGGDGVACGVGLFFAVNWVAALAGFMTWLLLVLISRENLVSSLWAVTTTIVLGTIPALYLLPVTEQFTYGVGMYIYFLPAPCWILIVWLKQISEFNGKWWKEIFTMLVPKQKDI